MDWLVELVKNITVSRALNAAVFVTASVMHFGSIHASGTVPSMPQDVRPYVFATMVLTGSLMLFWIASWIYGVVKAGSAKVGSKIGKALASRQQLSPAELGLISFMARDPSEPTNLDRIDYAQSSGTRLEYHQWASGLAKKGLVNINPYNENLLTLTPEGRETALKIQHAESSQ